MPHLSSHDLVVLKRNPLCLWAIEAIDAIMTYFFMAGQFLYSGNQSQPSFVPWPLSPLTEGAQIMSKTCF